MRNVNENLMKKMYDPYFKVNKQFASKYPTFGAFIKAVQEDDGTLIAKMYQPYASVNKKFRNLYPTLDVFAEKAYSKYLTSQKEAIKDQAKQALSELYRGDLDTLLSRRGEVLKNIQSLREERAQLPSSSTKGVEIADKLRRLESAAQLTEAFDAIDKADSDEEFDMLFEGNLSPQVSKEDELKTLSPEEKAQYDALSEMEKATWAPNIGVKSNKFLKQVMPSVEYKIFELESKKPDFVKTVFPEASRREGSIASTIGAVKDFSRLPGRLVRPLIEELFGTRAPGISYREELARPDKYKTAGQEMFDEVFGLQGLGGAASKAAATKVATVAPKLAGAVNRAMPFINPSEVILGRLGKDAAGLPLGSQMFWNTAKEAPGIGLDVAYEATRAQDEVGTPWLAGLGGVAGAAITPAVGRLLDGGGTRALRKEINQGTPLTLSQDLSLAKALMPDQDLTSTGGRKQIQEMLAGLGDARIDLAQARQKMAKDLTDKQILESTANTAEFLENSPYSNPVMYDRRESPRFLYLDEIAKAHPSKRKELIDEISREMGIGLDNDYRLRRMADFLQQGNLGNGRILEIAGSPLDPATKYASMMKYLEANPEKFKDLSALQTPHKHVLDLEKAIEARSKFREYGKGEGPYGAKAPLFAQAEEIQKNVMERTLGKSDMGQDILDKYRELARTYELEDKLPDLYDGSAVDSFLDRVGTSRMDITSKANFFDDILDLQKEVNRITGKNLDFVTPAVLRRVQSKSFWDDALGAGTTVGVGAKIASVLGSLGKDALTKGKIRTVVTQALEEAATENTPEKERQKQQSKGDYKEEVSDSVRRWQEYIKEAEKKRFPLAGSQ